MPTSEEKPLPGVGVFWIEETDYPAALKIFEDAETLPPAYKQWLKMAEEMEKGLKAYGHPVMRVRIDPMTFPIWCAAHGTTPGRARAANCSSRRRSKSATAIRLDFQLDRPLAFEHQAIEIAHLFHRIVAVGLVQ